MTETPKIDGRQVKIIIVDDEEIVLSLARDALEDIGYQIEQASSPRKALDIIEKEFFDFILTDIRMPEMDGIELANKARVINPSIGIIFMTGYANLTSAKDAIKQGAYDYIMKPFELVELRQAVRNAVKKKQKDIEKSLSTELNRLGDLNQLMYTVGDRKSLIRLSLGFAMMQTKVEKGCIVFRGSGENEIGTIITENLKDNEFKDTFKMYDKNYLLPESDELTSPFIISTLEEHPIYKQFNDPNVADIVIPRWFKKGDQLANIPLNRGTKLYGILILGFPEDGDNPKGSDLKFLSITANQIAISLENISLLEETQTAYSRLQDLQEQTIQLEKMATKGQMSAEIGHELNNYLGVVAGNLSLMEYNLDNENYNELKKHLKAALSNLDAMKKFNRGLMDFSSMTSNFETCDINTLISDTVEYIKTQKSFGKIKIEFNNSTLAIFAQADSGQLQQLLYNLVNNAGEAVMEKDDIANPQITISTNHDTDSNRYTISVSDNGAGMEQNLLEIAFKEQFTTKKTGHGFGLLVCRRIVDNHKGSLKVDSTPGKGTTIIIDFPIAINCNKMEIPA